MMVRILAFLAFAGPIACCEVAAAAKKPLPDAKLVDAAKRLVIETFRKELAATDKTPAIQTLLDTASKTEGDDSAQAALYLSAAEVAARAGETKLAFEALDRLAVAFEVDLLASKAAVMESAASHAQTAEARTSVANRCLELAEAAVRVNRFELAGEALKTATLATSKVADVELRQKIAAKRRDLQKARREADRIEAAIAAAQKRLQEEPNAPEANEIVGKHLCFDRRDWAQGVKFLAKAADRDLQKAALADRAGGTEPGQMATLGDWWWALAEVAGSDRDRAGYRSRALFWYTRAVGGLSGFAKARIEKRINDAGQEILAVAAEQTGGDNGNFIDVTLAPGVLMRLQEIPASADGKVKPFYLGRTEVTQKQWQAAMGDNPTTWKADALPVARISWKACQKFFDRLNASPAGRRLRFRFPTQAEFNHAYLAGQKHEFYVTHTAEYSWTRENTPTKGRSNPVAMLKPNAWGLYDMLGNCWEWCDDGEIWGSSAWNLSDNFAAIPPKWKYDKESDDTISFRVAASER